MTRENSQTFKPNGIVQKKGNYFKKKWNPIREECERRDESFRQNLAELASVAAHTLARDHAIVRNYNLDELISEAYVYAYNIIPKMLEDSRDSEKKVNYGSYLFRACFNGIQNYIHREDLWSKYNTYSLHSGRGFWRNSVCANIGEWSEEASDVDSETNVWDELELWSTGRK